MHPWLIVLSLSYASIRALAFQQAMMPRRCDGCAYQKARADHRCLTLHLLSDPSSAVDALNVAASTVSSSPDGISEGLEAFQTLSFRVIGSIAGTFVAGLAFTTISGVAIAAIFKDKGEKKESSMGFMNIFPSSSGGSATKKEDVAVSGESISGEAWLKLALCILIDLLGDVSYALPGVGEAEDAVWSPVSAFVLNQIFGNNVITTMEFVLQALPFTDFVPVATLAWMLQNVWKDNQLAKVLDLNKKRK